MQLTNILSNGYPLARTQFPRLIVIGTHELRKVLLRHVVPEMILSTPTPTDGVREERIVARTWFDEEGVVERVSRCYTVRRGGVEESLKEIE